MVFKNSNVFSNIITLLANLVFTGVFRFQCHNPLLAHAFSHSIFFFPNFFGPCDYLLQTSLNILHIYMFQTNSNLVIICGILACLGHDMTKTKTLINLLEFQRRAIDNRM
jgi:hypothetical protein